MRINSLGHGGELQAGRGAGLQIAQGVLDFNGVELPTGDGASLENPGTLTPAALQPTEALLFDLN